MIKLALLVVLMLVLFTAPCLMFGAAAGRLVGRLTNRTPQGP